jgi:endoglycosylceramidase
VFAISLLLLLMGTVVGSVEAAGLSPQVRSTGTYVGFLRTKGSWFVDAAGNTVILRGANFFGYEFGSLLPPNLHTEADYQKMASWGFNIVRLPIAWNLIEPKPNQYNDSYLEHTADRDLLWAQEYGIHEIIEMHQYCWSPRFTYCDSWGQAGIPLWATSGYPNSESGEAQARLDFWNGLGPNGTSVTQSNPSMQDRFLAMWQHVATRYGSSTVVAGYDLFNEPYSYSLMPKYGGSSYNAYNSTFSMTILPQFYTRLIDSIRTVDPNHICFWEAASEDWLLQPAHPVLLSRSNIAYSPHYPGQPTYENYDPTGVKWAMQGLAATSQKWKVPIFIGEWGMLADGSNVTNYIRDFSGFLDEYLMSAAWYSYGKSHWGMNLQDQYGNDRVILTQNLIRPYVGMAHGSPSHSSFSTDTRQLQIAIPGPCTVNVYVPPFHDIAQVNVDSGSASTYWVLGNEVETVSVTSGAKVVTVLLE